MSVFFCSFREIVSWKRSKKIDWQTHYFVIKKSQFEVLSSDSGQYEALKKSINLMVRYLLSGAFCFLFGNRNIEMAKMIHIMPHWEISKASIYHPSIAVEFLRNLFLWIETKIQFRPLSSSWAASRAKQARRPSGHDFLTNTFCLHFSSANGEHIPILCFKLN